MFIKYLKSIINYIRYSFVYDEIFFIKEQVRRFEENNFDRKNGLDKLNKLKNEFKFLTQPMSSEHQVLFSSISLNYQKKIKNILEIGTYDGTNAFLLSKLFPESKITTIDLEEGDKDFINTYGRESDEKLKNFCAERDKILKLSKNILFQKKSSIKLLFDNEKYDLIWVDGAHGYPIATMDILNSLRLCNDEGLIMCDDVYITKVFNADNIYYSQASYETLAALKNVGMLDFSLFFKRLTKENNSIPDKRKFIALVTKLKTEA